MIILSSFLVQIVKDDKIKTAYNWSSISYSETNRQDLKKAWE